MNIEFGQINWLLVAVCFVVGQVYLTLWFAVFFGTPWANAYSPGKTKAEHTQEVPGYTYAIGALCTFILVFIMNILFSSLSVSGIMQGIGSGVIIGFLSISTLIPGYVFLKRYNAMILAAGSQLTLILIISVILSVW